jgi:tripartite-type tricarboxylate transporter receptor subunit TctC
MFNKSSAVVAIRKNFPAETLSQFIEHARQNPGRLNIGHSGVGSQNYLFCRPSSRPRRST